MLTRLLFIYHFLLAAKNDTAEIYIDNRHYTDDSGHIVHFLQDYCEQKNDKVKIINFVMKMIAKQRAFISKSAVARVSLAMTFHPAALYVENKSNAPNAILSRGPQFTNEEHDLFVMVYFLLNKISSFGILFCFKVVLIPIIR